MVITGGPGRVERCADAGPGGAPDTAGRLRQPRNAVSAAVHGFCSRDGEDPAQLRRTAREQVAAYPTVQVVDAPVESAVRAGDGFEDTLAGGETARAPAAAARDRADRRDARRRGPRAAAVPWVYQPCCHGREERGRPASVLGGDDGAAHPPLSLARLGCDVVVCADGPPAASEPARDALQTAGVRVRKDLVLGVDGEPDLYGRLIMSPGWTLERRAPSVHPAFRQGSGLCRPARLRGPARRCRSGERAG